ncbi:MAG TPA: Ig-like domain-containing protein, partial [Myxococcaceae bacterium]|nr:Ig-like domain-containing protein [Myxococcaceae bacterium]
MFRLRHPRPPLLSGLLLALTLAGCEPGGETPPVQVQVSTQPAAINDRGESTTISVTVNQGTGVAATGSVTFTAPAGSFNGEGPSVTVALDGSSRASASFACDVAADSGCKGRLRLSAQWGTTVGYTHVDVGNAQPDEVDDGIVVDLALSASVDTVYLRVGQSSELTATVTDAANDDAPVVDEKVTFTTDRGFLGVNAATATSQSVSVTTNGQGIASVVLVEDGTAGAAQVSANARQVTTHTSVSFVDYASITQVAVSASPSTLYLGREEASVLTATVVDTADGSKPLAGEQVTFTTSAGSVGATAATATTRSVTAMTNGEGVATAVLVDGNVAGVALVSVEARQATAETSVNFVDLASITEVTLTKSKDPIYIKTGDASVLTATVMDTSSGKTPLAGEAVTFTTSAGFVGADAASATTRTVELTTDAHGKAVAVVVDGGAAGVAQISATSRQVAAQTSVSFVDLAAITRVTLTASRPNLYLGLGASSDLTVTVIDTANGDQPVEGEPVTVTTTAGYLGENAASAMTRTLELVTDAHGVARAVLIDDGNPGSAQVKVEARQTSTQTTVNFLEVASITHTGTKCGGSNCTVMGIRSSGFNETANVTFNVKDAQGRPAAGIPVQFSITNPPAETTVSPTAVTDAAGNATANVVAGPTTGVFAVRAVVIDGLVSTTSDSIGIRGAKPSNQGFALTCTHKNIATFANTPLSDPRQFSIDCTVKVVDRHGNPVGTGTPVSLLVEAGSVPASTSTTAYSPTGNNANEGVGTFKLSTLGGSYPPVDVAPLEADPNQLPRPRMAEPSGEDFALIRNPRDGFVTLMASVRGEEFFDDANSNGTWDPGEQFIDQGEPFVDSNDNGVWDPGERYVDQAPANGRWDGPNGMWDSDTTIWTETRILFTGYPDLRWSHAASEYSGDTEPLQFAGACANGEGLERETSTQIWASFLDLNLNRLQHANSSFSATRANGTKGTVAKASETNLDGFGFTWNRLLVRPTDGATCVPADPVCQWRIVF